MKINNCDFVLLLTYVYTLLAILYIGVTFSLRSDSIPTDGSGRVLITDINPDGDNNEDALICRSEREFDTYTSNGGISNWFLHPTELSTDTGDRIVSDLNAPDPRGWHRNRGLDSDHRLVRLRRAYDTAEEGVFTCDITGDINTPRSVGVYYPSEFILILIGSVLIAPLVCPVWEMRSVWVETQFCLTQCL